MDPELFTNIMIGLGAAALLGALIALVFERAMAAKSCLVAGIVIAAVGLLAMPLNYGIDLRGGYSLLYEVDTAGVSNPEETVQRTIQVLQDRVDPAGTRNLVWRVEAGNRIEIQMPLPPQHVIDRRDALRAMQDEVASAALTRGEVLAALRSAGEARRRALGGLERGVEGRAEALRAAAAAYDELQQAQAALEPLEPGTDEHIDQAGRVAEARIAFDTALLEVEATNLDVADLGRAVGLPDRPERDEQRRPVPGSSPRDREIARLKDAYPPLAGLIERYVQAHDAYEQVKGPLADPNDLKRLLRGAGVLEFRISAERDEVGDLADLRQRLAERGPRATPAGQNQRWFAIDDPAAFLDADEEQIEEFRGQVVQAASPEQRDGLVDRFFRDRGVGGVHRDELYILLWDTPGQSLTAAEEGWEVRNAQPTTDDLGMPAVAFQLDARGARLMGLMTGANVGRQMAIVLDGQVYSAPVIQDQLRGDIRVTAGARHGFTPGELEYLLRTLNAGALQARLSPEPISERHVGPALGRDNLERGLRSGVLALIVIAVFMMIYYFFAGAVADMALAANIAIILGVMSMIQATFTLPGIAGVVLTIGMCVDANVLIFERIREELRRGANMLTSLRLGYEKAFSAILDGNLTNLIICFILGYTASVDVRGFAVTLGIGIVATLFTSLFMTRVIFDLYYRTFGGTKRLNVLPLAVPSVERALSPAINWIGRRLVFFAISAVLVFGSVAAIAARGEDLLDIEFRAGTDVSFTLAEGERLTLAEARERLEDRLERYTVVSVGDVDEEGRVAQFSVVTTLADTDAVADIVRGAFRDVLDVQGAVGFADQGADDLRAAPVYPVTEGRLGDVINEPGVEDDVADYLGGVAMVLGGLDPPQTLEQIETRVREMRFQPDYEHVQFRRFEVFGIEPGADDPRRFRRAAVVSTDDVMDYFEDPDAWEAELAAVEWDLVRDAMGRERALEKVSNFSPTVARSMANQAIVALLLSLIAVVAYIWFRFGSLRYSLAAIAALIHDVLITLGLVAASGFIFDTVFGRALLLDPFTINMGMIAALLTIIGYSLNDTIVLFDRIRENRGKLAVASPAIINDSINQVISRTAITSFTTFIAVFFMYILGGPGIHGFAFALVVGVVIGTYSSIAFAAPLLLLGTKYTFTPVKPAAPPDRQPQPRPKHAVSER